MNRRTLALIGLPLVLLMACLSRAVDSSPQHGWWTDRGAVVPHDTFPADCRLCHRGSDWQKLTAIFQFDHEAETGVALNGAHSSAKCLRCHNDRGPVETFQARGCAGCHEDIHTGNLGQDCQRCHQESTWQPVGQIELHNRTRFPLVGVHAATSCRRCHLGAEIGNFFPTDPECITCHGNDLARAVNPNHAGLGWVNRCDRCHRPTSWNQAELDPNF